MTQDPRNPSTDSSPLTDEVRTLLSNAVRGLRYGQVILVVQDGRIVQIDRIEKHRLTSPG